MKKIILAITGLLLLSCGSTQKATSYLETGNYTEAFNTAVAELNKDKNSKANSKLIPLLEESYKKAAETDLAAIKSLKQNPTIENLKQIYGNYLNLDIRQDEVKALQPLYYEGREANFKFDDYTNQITKSKAEYSEALYSKAVAELKGGTLEARSAYKHLEDLNYVNPGYKSNIDALMQSAKEKGSSFVLLTLKNNTTISKDSLAGFTNINSANFSNPWVIFHDKKERNRSYNYQVDISIDKLTFEPEKLLQEKVNQQAQVQDGWKYQLDSNGNVMKDKDGNDIKVANVVTVQAEVMLYQQNKSAKLDGTVSIKDLKNKTAPQTKQDFGEAKFQNTYAKYRGDQRAIEQKYYEALQNKEVPYPKDWEFTKYAVSNFKDKVTAILSQQQF